MTTYIVVSAAIVAVIAALMIWFEHRVRRAERFVMRSVRSYHGDWIGARLISASFDLKFSMVTIAGDRLVEVGLIDRKVAEDADGTVIFYRAKVR